MNRRRNKKSFLRRLFDFLGITNELTAEEKLELFIRNQKQSNLLERLESIRTNGYFEPNYNKPPVFTDVVITFQKPYKENGVDIFVETPISHCTITTCERPIDFNNDIKAWMKFVRLDHKKELKQKDNLELERQKKLRRTIPETSPDKAKYILRKSMLAEGYSIKEILKIEARFEV